MNIIEIVTKMKLKQKSTRTEWDGEFFIQKVFEEGVGEYILKRDFDKKYPSEYDLLIDDIVAQDWEMIAES
jgi:hypothetical protein